MQLTGFISVSVLLPRLVFRKYISDKAVFKPSFFLFHDLLLTPISQHSIWSEITSCNPLR